MCEKLEFGFKADAVKIPENLIANIDLTFNIEVS